MHGVHPAANAIPTSAEPRYPTGFRSSWSPALLVQQPRGEHSQAKKTEDNDQHTSDPLQPDLIVVQCAPESGGAGAEQDEDQGEAGDEEERVQQGLMPPGRHLRQRHSGQEAEVGGHQRQDAGREEAEQAGHERHQEPECGRLAHSGPSSRCRQARQTP